ncbi:cytochrome c oxidase subunit cyclope [Xylocopa sonorina]|uniref:cytochrome c oxidase subunit cyclope n=1 Tax=Xylocopa sonorina TaxID=1818115 RepID=UPI00403AFFB0
MAEGRLPKPQLRNLHLNGVKRNLVVSLVVTAISGIAYKLLVNDPYERKVEEFYKNYDPMAALKVMNEAGLMQSAPQD